MWLSSIKQTMIITKSTIHSNWFLLPKRVFNVIFTYLQRYFHLLSFCLIFLAILMEIRLSSPSIVLCQSSYVLANPFVSSSNYFLDMYFSRQKPWITKVNLNKTTMTFILSTIIVFSWASHLFPDYVPCDRVNHRMLIYVRFLVLALLSVDCAQIVDYNEDSNEIYMHRRNYQCNIAYLHHFDFIS